MTYTPLTPDQLTSLERRFWPKVDRSGECWLFTGTKNRKGYGTMAIGETRSIQATWAALLVHGRAVPAGKQVVMHLCDNPPCVNPDHLRVDTYSANRRDMVEKGRAPDWIGNARRGENHPSARLTWDQVCEIRAKSAGGTAQWPLAREYGVSRSTIKFIVQQRIWRVAA